MLGDKHDRWRSFSGRVLDEPLGRKNILGARFFQHFVKFSSPYLFSSPPPNSRATRVTLVGEFVAAWIEFVSRKNRDFFFPSFFDRGACSCDSRWGSRFAEGEEADIECTLTRHPVSRLYSLPDNYNDNEASDDRRRWPAHTRPCSLLFILRSPSLSLSLSPARPPILAPQALGAFVGIRGNFACWQLFHSARESRAPEYYYSIVFQRRAIVFNHNAPLRKFRKAMRYVSRNKPGHRRISERFSATGIVIRP